MNEIENLAELIRTFAEKRDWGKFHTPKNLAMAITGEAGELASEFQWLSNEEVLLLSKQDLDNVRLEIADVGIYLIRLCDVLNISLSDAIKEKLALNEKRFPELDSGL
jgi:NTP pyrophosphatase (non-canonical NTP hydrolase)